MIQESVYKQYVARIKEKLKVAEEALAEYANATSWIVSKEEYTAPKFTGWDFDRPWGLAAEALAEIKPEDRTDPPDSDDDKGHNWRNIEGTYLVDCSLCGLFMDGWDGETRCPKEEE